MPHERLKKWYQQCQVSKYMSVLNQMMRQLKWSSCHSLTVQSESPCCSSWCYLVSTEPSSFPLSLNLKKKKNQPLSWFQEMPTNWGYNCSSSISLTPQTESSLGPMPRNLSACLFSGLAARLNFSRCCLPNLALINSICSPLLCHCFLVTLVVFPAVICVGSLSSF